MSVFLEVDTAVLVVIKEREHRAQTGYGLGLLEIDIAILVLVRPGKLGW
jgi:hypothetical protein